MTKPPSKRLPRGRPKDPAKREALLEAARALFLRHGPDTVTIDQIVAEAGVARDTLYANFSDKTAILEAVILNENDDAVSRRHAAGDMSGDFESNLVKFGLRLLHFLSNPETIAMERLIATATRDSPKLARRFYVAGPEHTRKALTRIVKSGHDQGLICAEDATVAAADLAGLWQGFLHAETAFGTFSKPTAAKLRRQVVHGVHQFLRLYAPSPQGKNSKRGR